MKSGARTLGIAESYHSEVSTLCGAVVTTDGALDGCGFTQCSVGGTDSTDSILELWSDVGRPDIQAVLLNGVALAWYNIVDLLRVSEAIPVPVIAITYEESDGLRDAIAAAFNGAEANRRLDLYESLPPRREIIVNDESLFIRVVGDGETAEELVRAVTPAGGRPEPVRVARILARAADRYCRSTGRKPES